MLKLCCLLLALCIAEVSCATSEAAEGILDEILNDYNPSTVPRKDENETLSLEFGSNLIYLQIDGNTGLANIFCWERYQWQDNRLKWDPSAHGGISQIRVESSKVWVPYPDFTLYSSIEVTPEVSDRMMVVVYSSGLVLWVPKVQRKAVCEFKGSGVYDCQLKFGSWTMDGSMLMPKFFGDKEEFDLSAYMERNEYEITSNKAVRERKKYDCCEEIYPNLKFQITAERKEGFTNSATALYAHILIMLFSSFGVFLSY